MENGIIINGKFYKAEWVGDLVASIIAEATAAATNNLLKELDSRIDKQQEKDEKKMYKVHEVATVVKKANSTVAYHIRIGLLVAHKVGKSWLITEESLQKYRLNQH